MYTKSLLAQVRKVFTVLAALCALIASAVYVTPAHAAGIVVNTAGDIVNANDGLCSLREAITTANTNTPSGPAAGECAAGFGADTISFAGDYTITLAPARGQLPIVTSPITINGRGAANTVIRAHVSPDTATTRVFYVDPGGNLTLNKLTVRNGRCNGSCTGVIDDGGGGIYNVGTLTVKNSVIAANSASGFGGGIYNIIGTLIVMNSVISGNSSNSGGGIASSADLTVTRSTFADNSSSISGGGIYQAPSFIDASVTNSTFSGNTSDLFGGGIYSTSENRLNVTNSTFSNNAASGSGAAGGGIYQAAGAGTVTLKNTIVANSTAGGNCSAGITNGGNNLDSGATCGWGSTNGSQSNANPKLGPLASNGGPTKTMALLPGSPAIDAGADPGCPATDQRGKPRPQGAHCDIGAYESPTVTTLKSVGAQDGWVLETSENSNQGGLVNATAPTFVLGDDAENKQFRAILSFNTSALPDNAVISGVVLKIKRQSITGKNPFGTHGKILIDIRKGAFSNAAALQPTDFQAAANKPGVGVFVNKPRAGGWYVTRLNAAAFPYIHTTGITQLRLRFHKDDDNDRVADFLRFYSGNSVGANRPVLVVEYYVP
jgi:CSLREA domain-containing protein